MNGGRSVKSQKTSTKQINILRSPAYNSKAIYSDNNHHPWEKLLVRNLRSDPDIPILLGTTIDPEAPLTLNLKYNPPYMMVTKKKRRMGMRKIHGAINWPG